jgi:cytochrome c553
MLLKNAAASVDEFCTTCHGALVTGATTDVESGVQYAPVSPFDENAPRSGTELGALRGGGFVTARIDTAGGVRYAYRTVRSGNSVTSWASKIPVLSASATSSQKAVTSAHLQLTGATGVTLQDKAWGNIAQGTFSATANPGPTLDLECASCHNPHGNGQYRILNKIPTDGTGPLVEATTAAVVTDAPPVPVDGVRNYTVIQVKGTPDYVDTGNGITGDPGRYNWVPNSAYDAGSYLLYASQIAGPTLTADKGDYLHRRVPWDGIATGASANDAPNGLPSTFNAQINAWCATCHTRYTTSTSALSPTSSSLSNNSAITYPSNSGSYSVSSGDAIFKYRHSTTSNKPCTTCHVAHGSNAKMTGDASAGTDYSGTVAYPGGTTPNDSSRLLKADNRGLCQLCHEPTGTLTVDPPEPTNVFGESYPNTGPWPRPSAP